MARDYAKPRNPNAPRKGGNARGGRGGPPPRGGGGGGGALPGWVWLAVGLSIGAVVAAFAYIEKPQHRTRLGQDVVHEGADASALVSGGKPGAAARDRTDTAAATAGKDQDKSPRKPDKAGTGAATGRDGKAPAVPPGDASSRGRYTFYDELQEIEVSIPREYAPPPALPGKPAIKPTVKPPPAPPEIREALATPGAYLIQVGAYKSREEADRQRARLGLLGYESRIEQVTRDNGVVFRVRIGPQPNLAAAQVVVGQLQSNGVEGFLVKPKN